MYCRTSSDCWFIGRVVLFLVILGGVSRDGFAQANQPPDKPTVVIADEPRTIDPASLLAKELAEHHTVSFDGASLREVANWLNENSKIPVIVDQRALAEKSITLNETINDHLDDQPLYLLLNRLRALQLDWYVEGDVLHVTTMEQAEQHLTTRPYNVAELLDAGYFDSNLVETIETTIAVDSWSTVGGEGVAELLGDVLFIRQSERNHLIVKGLLIALKQHGRQTYVADPQEHIAIRERLTKKVSVAFEDAPLEEAVKQLGELSGTDIRLDRISLQQQRIGGREPVRLHLTDRKLITVLSIMLRNLRLEWALRDGVLWIVSADTAETIDTTAVYDVRDLCRDASESDALGDAIMSQTVNDQWADVGGRADLSFPRPGVMVVLGREQVHREVLDLLERYRMALRSSKPRKHVDPRQEFVTVYYRMHKPVAQGLLSYLPRVVQPELWLKPTNPEGKGMIDILPSTPTIEENGEVIENAVLIIHQTREVHGEISDIIQSVLNGDSHSKMKGMGGGMGGFGGGMFRVDPGRPNSPRNGRASAIDH